MTQILDGRTSGQHNPIYAALAPYAAFPTKIAGPTLWHKEDYQDAPEKWIHPFSADEIAELGATADAFIEGGKELTAITKVFSSFLSFFLSSLRPFLSLSPPFFLLFSFSFCS